MTMEDIKMIDKTRYNQLSDQYNYTTGNSNAAIDREVQRYFSKFDK